MNTAISGGGASTLPSLNLKYLDVVDLTADNISCKTLSIDGEPIGTAFTTDKLTTKELIAVNRDLSICDADGNGNPGTNPNAGYQDNMFWGKTEFGSEIHIIKRQNPAEFFNSFGIVCQMTNPYAKTSYDAFGNFRASSTMKQFGHDFDATNNTVLEHFKYYGDGLYLNNYSLNPNGQILSPYQSLTLRLPAENLYTICNTIPTELTVVNNVATMRFLSTTPTPKLGMTVTVKGTPSTIDFKYAVITSIDDIAPKYVTFNVTSPNLTSTAIEYAYFGPMIYTTTPNSTTVYVEYINGPIPQVGQNIYVDATPSVFNTDTGTSTTGRPITSVTVGSVYTVLTYEVLTPISSVTNASGITNVLLKAGNPYTSNDPLGILGNIGIHNSLPRAPLDVNGNVIFRDRATKRPLLKTLTEGTTQSLLQILSTASSGETPFAEFDSFNSQFKLYNTATGNSFIKTDAVNNQFVISNTEPGKFNLMEMDAINNLTIMRNVDTNSKVLEVDHFAPSVKILGTLNQTNGIALFLPAWNKVAFGSLAADELAASPSTSFGFTVSQAAVFRSELFIQSPETGATTTELKVGRKNATRLIQTDTTNTRVGININTPLHTLHVNGNIRGTQIISDYTNQTSPPFMVLTLPETSIANNASSSVGFTARDTLLDNGTTGPTTGVFTNNKLVMTHDSVNLGRFTNTNSTKQWVRVEANIGFASNTTGVRQVSICLYTSAVPPATIVPQRFFTTRINANPSSGITFVSASATFPMAANEWFNIQCFQNSGAPLNTYTDAITPSNVRVMLL